LSALGKHAALWLSFSSMAKSCATPNSTEHMLAGIVTPWDCE
jgi:hypothetical protein